MKKIIPVLFLMLILTSAFAKKVRFAVDMTGQTLSPNGIHVSGDFQTLAGFPGGDWNSATTTCAQEGTTDIYSVIVDIPAFAKYEYKFVNGDQFYEVEFIPEPSRVGYNFNDNRWIYIDSLASDTTDIGALIFGGNAPAGLTLVRFYVNMQNEILSSNSVHVAGTFQNTNPWNPATDIMYSFGANVYEIIKYVTTGAVNYKFYNGNTVGDAENLPGACSVFGNREVQVSGDTLLTIFCFGSCSACVTGISENNLSQSITLSPNPAHNYSLLQLNNNGLNTISITDVSGRIIKEYKNYSEKTLRIEKENFESGIYFVNVVDENNFSETLKLILK